MRASTCSASCCVTRCGGPTPKPAPKNPCAESHKKLFYLNDFSYLEDPNYRGHCFGDQLKLMPLDPAEVSPGHFSNMVRDAVETDSG